MHSLWLPGQPGHRSRPRCPIIWKTRCEWPEAERAGPASIALEQLLNRQCDRGRLNQIAVPPSSTQPVSGRRGLWTSTEAAGLQSRTPVLNYTYEIPRTEALTWPTEEQDAVPTSVTRVAASSPDHATRMEPGARSARMQARREGDGWSTRWEKSANSWQHSC